MNAITDRTPQLIAAEIRSIDAQTREIVLRSAIEIGRRLNEAKALVAHGEWGTWLEANVNYSQSTANNFMRVAEEYGSNFQALENLSYTQAVALLAVPAEDREQFAADVGAENLSTRELQEAIKEKKRLEKELKNSQDAAEKERKAREELERKSDDYAQRISRLQTELADAQADFNDEKAEELQKELNKSHEELGALQAKVRQLEAELKAKPIEVPAKVEVIPPEVEAELAELRKKASGGAMSVKFKLQFDSLAGGFRDLLASLEEVKTTDPELADKYKGAVSGLLDKMKERITN